MEQAIFSCTLFFLNTFRKWKPLQWPERQFKLPPYQVHRGYHLKGIQENTLEAFREAKLLGAEMIELDVQLSKDNVPIVFHDYNLDRWCKEKSLLVAETLAADLKTKVNAPTLLEVLNDPHVTKYINIELKQVKSSRTQFAKRVAEIVMQSNAKERVIFSSFDPLLLRAIGRELPDVLRAMLITKRDHGKPAAKWVQNYWAGGVALCHMLNIDSELCTDEYLEKVNQRNIPFAVWTVNNPNQAENLRKKGAISIISDLEKI